MSSLTVDQVHGRGPDLVPRARRVPDEPILARGEPLARQPQPVQLHRRRTRAEAGAAKLFRPLV